MIQIYYPDAKLTDVSRMGQDKLKEVTLDYLQDVLDESRHIEALRVKSDSPEITADIIYDASHTVRKYGAKRKKSVGFLTLQILFFVVCSIIGLFGFTDFNTNIKIMAYGAILFIGIILQILIWVKE